MNIPSLTAKWIIRMGISMTEMQLLLIRNYLISKRAF